MACFMSPVCYSGLEYSILSVLKPRHDPYVFFELHEAGEQLSIPENHGNTGWWLGKWSRNNYLGGKASHQYPIPNLFKHLYSLLWFQAGFPEPFHMQCLTVLSCFSASKPYYKMLVHHVDPIHGITGQKTLLRESGVCS